jgi:RNA polymerase sigma-70 factor (ECF subfamily)
MSPGTNSQSGLSYPIEDTGAGMPRPDADAALVSSAQRGDLNAFEALVRRHQKQMLNIAFRMVDDYDEACEIVQDAFVAAYKNIKTFRREAKFTTWLTTITLNLSKNRLKQIKSRQRNIAFSLDDMVRTGDGQVAIDPPSKEPSVLDSMEKQDVRTKVQDCIKALEPDFREVLVLRDMQDFPYEDIAGMLKIRSGTVKSRLFRAREMVRDCLKRVKGAL